MTLAQTLKRRDNEIQVEQHDDHAVIHPPKRLQKKANIRMFGDASLDMEAIAQAEKKLEELSKDFSNWMLVELNKLTQAFTVFEKEMNEESKHKLFVCAHDIRGQATTYGYPVAARLASIMADILDDTNTSSYDCRPLARRMVEGIIAIVRQDAKAEHPVATELERELYNLARRENTAL
jgi:chemotaxis protein histidine kinase CheA